MKRGSINSFLVALIMFVCAYKCLMYCTAFLVVHPRNALYLSRVIESQNISDPNENLYFKVLEKNVWAAKDTTRQQIICDGILLTVIMTICYRWRKNLTLIYKPNGKCEANNLVDGGI
jgi:hypothetical protein